MPSKLVRASLWSIGGSATQYTVIFGLLVYLAHVLQPRDFGLMSMIAVGLDLGTQIVRWGQIELLQQVRYRNDEARNQSFRLSLAIGAIFTMLFFGAASPIGRFYGSNQITLMMYLCAPVFLLTAARTAPEAILRSEFRFRLFAFRSTITTITGGVVAIILAKRGFGPVALAAQSLVQSAMLSIWVWTAVAWRPRLVGRMPQSRPLVHEGASVVAGTVLPVLVPRSVDLFVGLFLGPTQLGFLRVAYRINDFVSQIVVTPLVSIAHAQLSSFNGDTGPIRDSYLRLTQASAALMCPLLIGLALVAREAIPLVFGAKWHGAVPLVQIMGLLGLVAPLNFYFAPAMVALGFSRLILRQGIFQLILAFGLAAVAARISIEAVVIANVIRGMVVGVYNIVDLRGRMRLRFTELWHFMAAPYLSTGAMTLAVVGARMLLGGGATPWTTLVCLTAAGAVTYGATLWLGGRAGLWPAHASLLNLMTPARSREVPART